MASRSSSRRAPSPAPAAEVDFGSLKPQPVYLISGEDEFLVAQTARRLVDHLCPEAERAFGLEIVDTEADLIGDALPALHQCQQGLQTIGFFGGRKVVWLRDARFMGSLRTMASVEVKAALENLVKLLKAGLAEGTHLVINAPKVDKRGAFYRACKEVGMTIEFDLPTQAYKLEEHAKARATEYLKKAGLKMNDLLLNEFVARAGTDSRQLSGEVEKLSLYLGDRREATLEDIRSMVSTTRESAGWDLADAVGERDLPRALQMVRQLDFQGMSSVAMIITLENRFRELLILRQCLEQELGRLQPAGPVVRMVWRQDAETDQALAGFGRMDPRNQNQYRTGTLGRQAQKFTRAELMRAHQLCVDLHLDLITAGLPGPLPVELLLIRLLGSAATHRKGA